MTSTIYGSQGKRGLERMRRAALDAGSASGVGAAMLIAIAAATLAGILLSQAPRWSAAERSGDPFCIGVARNAPDDGFFRSNNGADPSSDPAAQGLDDE
jgi:hypothetical protein